MDGIPLCIRLDGKNFSNVKRDKPFDPKFTAAMLAAANKVFKESNAKFCYTSSDEITLILIQETDRSQHYLGGKFFKLNSILASYATIEFNKIMGGEQVFDCRSFNVPDDIEAMNLITWRFKECRRNAILTMAQDIYSHKQLQGLSTSNVTSMINYSEMPDVIKYGTFIRKDMSESIDFMGVDRMEYIYGDR